MGINYDRRGYFQLCKSLCGFVCGGGTNEHERDIECRYQIIDGEISNKSPDCTVLIKKLGICKANTQLCLISE